jgi:hypothetical protein
MISLLEEMQVSHEGRTQDPEKYNAVMKINKVHQMQILPHAHLYPIRVLFIS